MAKELYDWVKLALDNKWLVMLFITSVGGISTGITQYVGKQEAIQNVKESHDQIKNVAEHLTKNKPKRCSECKSVQEHEQEYHR